MHQLNLQLARIQQVDEIAKETLVNYQQKLPEKYANIQATLKLLNNLIASFRKRAEHYENELKHRAKLKDLMEQIEFHRARISDCERMSAALEAKVNKKRGNIATQETTVREMRKELLELKTSNVKKILQLETLEEKHRDRRNKENMETRKATWRMKTQISRGLHVNSDNADDELALEKLTTVKCLYGALKKKKQVQQLMEEAWSIAKAKLLKQEKKANDKGLNGSLMFKILENDCSCPGKPLNDPKLIIYDVLKAKHKAYRKEQQAPWAVSEEQFMEYAPMQVLGIIQLHGGLSKLTEAITLYERQLNQDKSTSIHQ